VIRKVLFGICGELAVWDNSGKVVIEVSEITSRAVKRSQIIVDKNEFLNFIKERLDIVEKR